MAVNSDTGGIQRRVSVAADQAIRRINCHRSLTASIGWRKGGRENRAELGWGSLLPGGVWKSTAAESACRAIQVRAEGFSVRLPRAVRR